MNILNEVIFAFAATYHCLPCQETIETPKLLKALQSIIEANVSSKRQALEAFFRMAERGDDEVVVPLQIRPTYHRVCHFISFLLSLVVRINKITRVVECSKNTHALSKDVKPQSSIATVSLDLAGGGKVRWRTRRCHYK